MEPNQDKIENSPPLSAALIAPATLDEVVSGVKFSSDDLRFNFPKYSPSEEFSKEANVFWEKIKESAKAQGRAEPFNGTLVGSYPYPTLSEDGKSITLHLRSVPYSHHMFSMFNEGEEARRIKASDRTNTLNSISTLTTTDGYLAIPLRGETLSLSGKLSSFGEVIPSADHVKNGGSRYLFDQIKECVLRESGISGSPDVAARIAIEGAETSLYGICTVFPGFSVPLWNTLIPLTKDALEKTFANYDSTRIRGSNALKHKALYFVDISKEGEVLDLLTKRDVAFTVRPLFERIVLRQFGADFLREAYAAKKDPAKAY